MPSEENISKNKLMIKIIDIISVLLRFGFMP
ncbi:hypothetical protein GFO_1115 [Christiangramia forsetii KT0803]|uniref:Uncharacterized protein n=1 Tax=Christiangramia forsetii (strain DSM 17595 / CGMCC 1.15422 / KT0803) TaxID=411154 RepID=A0M0E4_CHRFK|nr:hypothetical protein GFO_1115 [Christiangramia forsetii KT0803]